MRLTTTGVRRTACHSSRDLQWGWNIQDRLGARVARHRANSDLRTAVDDFGNNVAAARQGQSSPDRGGNAPSGTPRSYRGPRPASSARFETPALGSGGFGGFGSVGAVHDDEPVTAELMPMDADR